MKNNEIKVRRYFFYEFGKAMTNIKMYFATSKKSALAMYNDENGFTLPKCLVKAYYIGSMPIS